jgi:hypothetical protein
VRGLRDVRGVVMVVVGDVAQVEVLQRGKKVKQAPTGNLKGGDQITVL